MAFDPTQIQAGTLRHVIEIQSQSTSRDELGQLNSTWTTILTTRAAIENTTSQTFKYTFQNNVLASNATDCITMRFPYIGTTPLNVTPGMRVTWRDQTYTIQAVDNVQRRDRVLILAVVGISTGSN
jgi:SPP1 family predicted phage head-tail adaptor